MVAKDGPVCSHSATSLERLWVYGKFVRTLARYAFSNFSTACCAWKQHASKAPAWKEASIATKSLQAFRKSPLAKSAWSFIDGRAFSQSRRDKGHGDSAPFRDLRRRID